MKRKINRAWRVVMIVLVVLVAFRLSLPYILTRYVNGILGDLGPYTGRVEDVNVHLLRVAYDLVDVTIADTAKVERPVFHAPLIELSVEWGALLDGSVTSEAILVKPTLNFYAGQTFASDSAIASNPAKLQWRDLATKLFPIPMNHIQVNAGKVNFTDSASSPSVVVALNFVQIDAQNLQNVKESPEELPSRIYMQALSSGNGQLNIAAKANVQKDIPAVDMDVRFEKVDLKGLQPLFTAYADAVVKEGDFNLYAEINIDNGQMTGYVKPLFENVNIAMGRASTNNSQDHQMQILILKISEALNRKFPDKFITRVSMKAQMPSEKSQFWPAVWSTFSNAFTDSFGNSNVNTVALATAPVATENVIEEEESSKSKKELRKERRKEKREEKRRLKSERKSVENAKRDDNPKGNS